MTLQLTQYKKMPAETDRIFGIDLTVDKFLVQTLNMASCHVWVFIQQISSFLYRLTTQPNLNANRDGWHDSFTRVTWRIHTRDMTHSHAWHDSIIVSSIIFRERIIKRARTGMVTWLICMCDVAELHVWYDAFRCDRTNSRVTWCIDVWRDTIVCDMNPSCNTRCNTRCNTHYNAHCMAHVNKSWHTWMSHCIYIACAQEKQHMMSHGTHKWVTTHMNESWHTWKRHGTLEWVMAPILPLPRRSSRKAIERRLRVSCNAMQHTLQHTVQYTETHCNTQCNTLKHTATHRTCIAFAEGKQLIHKISHGTHE